jgi:hypothetical protein
MSVPSPNITMKPEPRPSLYTGFRTPPTHAVPPSCARLRGSLRTSGKAPQNGQGGWGSDCHARPSGPAPPLRASGDGAKRGRRSRRSGGPGAAGGRLAPPVSAGPVVSRAFSQPRCLFAPSSISTLPAQPPSRSRLLPSYLDLDRLFVPGVAWASARQGGVANAGSSFRSPPLQLIPLGLCPGTTGRHAARLG